MCLEGAQDGDLVFTRVRTKTTVLSDGLSELFLKGVVDHSYDGVSIDFVLVEDELLVEDVDFIFVITATDLVFGVDSHFLD